MKRDWRLMKFLCIGFTHEEAQIFYREFMRHIFSFSALSAQAGNVTQFFFLLFNKALLCSHLTFAHAGKIQAEHHVHTFWLCLPFLLSICLQSHYFTRTPKKTALFFHSTQAFISKYTITLIHN